MSLIFIYSIRVSIVACISLVFVFFNTLNFSTNTQTKISAVSPPNLSFINSINAELSNFSQKIINTEIFSNEKEKR